MGKDIKRRTPMERIIPNPKARLFDPVQDVWAWTTEGILLRVLASAGFEAAGLLAIAESVPAPSPGRIMRWQNYGRPPLDDYFAQHHSANFPSYPSFASRKPFVQSPAQAPLPKRQLSHRRFQRPWP